MKTLRKKNRLAGFDYSQSGAYFITVCVKDHQCLLGTVVGAGDHTGPYTALSSTGKIVEKYTRSIPGIAEYTVMPNHVHMILRISSKVPGDGPMWSSAPTGVRGDGPMWSSAPTDANVVDLIRTWKTLITKELGQSIWQRSYYDHIIRNEEEYRKIGEYILGNPGKWSEDKYYAENIAE